MFGGTKGKFNGLELLQGGSSRPLGDDSQSRGRSSPNPRRQRDDYDDYYDDDDEEDYEDDIEDDYYLRGKEDDLDYDDDRDYKRLSIRRRPLPPPSEEDDDRLPSRPSRRRSSRGSQGRSRRSRQRTQEDDWISSEVSGWFEPDEDRNERRSRRKKKDESSPLSFLAEKMFGDDDDNLSFKAEMYEQQLGKRKKKSRRSKRPSSYGYDDDDSTRRRRPGYAYRYVDDDPSSPVVDIESSNAQLPNSQSTTPSSPSVVDVTVEDGTDTIKSDSTTNDEASSSNQSRKMTWTERAEAVERVPPSGIAAWGPSGDVGMDARTKATLDALEEIREAKRKLELREEKVIVAQEDMIVVRADAELQKKRLLARNRAREVRGMLRRIEEDVDYASMGLRRAKAQAAAARDQLNDLEAQHWALLSLYDADKAFNEVIQTIEELDNTDFGRPKVDESADSTTTLADLDTTDKQTNDAKADSNDVEKTDAV